MKCPHCAAENKDAAKFCGKCGQSLTTSPAQNENTKSCPGCGHTCKQDARFCPKCGHNFSALPPAQKTVATTGEAPASAIAHDMMPCPHCGATLKFGAKFCGTCGSNTSASAPVDKPVIETAANESPKPSRKVPMAAIAAGLTALAIALGTGGYFLIKGKLLPDANKGALVNPTMQPAESPMPSLAAAPQSEELPPPNRNQGIPGAAPVPPAEYSVTKPPIRESTPVEREAVPAQENPLQTAIDASLEEGQKCMSRKKFDCAISSANTILRLDSGNAQALEMKRKAKEAQDRALSQIEIQ